MTRLFEAQARVKAAFGEERTVTTQAVPLALIMDTPWAPVRAWLSFIVLPGGHYLFVLGQKH